MESVDTVIITVESESTMCIIIQHHLFTSHLDVFHPFPTELMSPVLNERFLSSIAGQPLSVECRFQVLANLIRPPSVQWMNSSGSVLSNTDTVIFSPLLTSHGGEYTCIVSINITELGILLTNEGNTRIIVQSKHETCFSLLSNMFVFSSSSYSLCRY